VLVVSAAIVSEEPERLLLPNEEAMDTVRAVMQAGGVAAKRDVVGKLFNFVAEGDGALPGVQRRTVWSSLDVVRQDVAQRRLGRSRRARKRTAMPLIA
jgi:hypothetical protein